MEAASITAKPARRPGAALKAWISRFGLIIFLVALPVVYGIKDLSEDGNLVGLGNNLLAGVSNGAIWALIAIGYTLVYGIIELINFAHGDNFMLGSFVAFSLYSVFGLTTSTGTVGLILGLLACLIIAAAVCALINVMIERVGYRPLRNAPKLAPLITAVGFSFILQNVGILWLGPSQVSIPDLINAQHVVVTILGIQIRNAGKAMRATAQDPEAARLMGINVDTTISFTFMLGGLMAGAAGLVFALYQTTIWYFSGFQAGLIAFTAAVMGGIGNIQGAVLGGLIIGCIQQIADDRIGAQWTPAVVFFYLIVIMVFRPQGLLGEETREAG